MFKVAIVLYPGAHLTSIGVLIDALDVANSQLARQGRPRTPLFERETVSVTSRAVPTSGGMPMRADLTLADAVSPDLVYIPSFNYEGVASFEDMVAEQKPTLEWLAACWRSGSQVAANCTGTLLLAESGLLDGRKSTTSWWIEEVFRRRFPAVHLDVDATLTSDERLITTGAIAASLQLAVSIIAQEAGPQVAAMTARTMLIEAGPASQLPYRDLSGGDPSFDPLVVRGRQWLQNHIGESVSQAEFARAMNVSQRTLIRHFKAELGVSPLTHLQNLRIDTAKQLLETTNASVEEITGAVGYHDVSSFRRLFKDRTGSSPATYRSRFNLREERLAHRGPV